MSDLILFSCGNTKLLAIKLAKKLGATLGTASLAHFSDGELQIHINNDIYNTNVFILQSTESLTINNNLIELSFLADAIQQAYKPAIINITVIMPYFGYARQKNSALLILKLLAAAGISKILTIDLHSIELQKLSPITLHNIATTNLFINDLKDKGLDNLLIVSPDLGGIARTRSLAKLLNNIALPNIVIITKQRLPRQNVAMQLLGDGTSIQNKHCIIVDDIVDTANTICQAASLLKANGALTVTAYCTHAILSRDSVINITNSGLDEIVVTNSIPLSADAVNCPKIRQLCINNILVEAIKISNHQNLPVN